MVALSDSSLKVAWDCMNPYQLTKTSTNLLTGNTESVTYLKKCGTRLKSKCEPCSNMYRRDARELLETGIFEHIDKIKNARVSTFITLTAPGEEVFGRLHKGPLKDGQKIEACSCKNVNGKRNYHKLGDPLISTAINPETYNYVAAAQFNANASRLYAVTIQKLRRITGENLEVIKVAEYQVRGLIHYHAIVIGKITQEQLKLAVEGDTQKIPTTKYRKTISHGFSFGDKCKADIIYNVGNSNRTISYVLKYALKSATSDTPRKSKHTNEMVLASKETVACSIIRCDACKNHRNKTCVVCQQNNGGKCPRICSCYINECTMENGITRENTCRNHRAAARGLGARGHVLTKSRNWKTTFKVIRARRETYMQKQNKLNDVNIFTTWQGQRFDMTEMKQLKQLVTALNEH